MKYLFTNILAFLYNKCLKLRIPLVAAIGAAPSIFSYMAEAAPIKTASGQAFSGTIACPNGQTYPNEAGSLLTMSFTASKGQSSPSFTKQQVSGSFDIALSFQTGGRPFFVHLLGAFDNGQITNNKFGLTGTQTFDEVCAFPSTNTVPVTATISGQCGQGVSIQFQAANGERADFTGNVVCVT